MHTMLTHTPVYTHPFNGPLVMVWYGIVNVDLYGAIITKVSNALDTLVSGEKPGFQTTGPCTANARRPTVVSRCRGTTISCCVADLRRCLATTSSLSGLNGWVGTRKVKPIWILMKQEIVSGSGISWAICKSASHSRQITMPAPTTLVFYRPDALPAAQPTASKHWRQTMLTVTVKT